MKKNFVFLFSFLLISNIFSENIENNLDQKTVAVKIIFTFDETMAENSGNIDLQEILKNKKRRKAKIAAFLGVFVKLLTSVVNIINGNPKEAVANIVGSVITAAAQATQVQSDYEKDIAKFELSDDAINKLILNVSEILYSIVCSDIYKSFDLSLTPLLQEFVLIDTQEKRASWIANNLLDNFFVQAFLKDSIKYLNYYLHAKVDIFTAYLQDTLLV
jgi:uncharacterized membrane protein (DUF441 family)